MSPLSSLFFALVLGLAFSGFSFSVADRHKILQRDPSEAFCPLNFDVLRKLVIKGVRRPAFRDIPTQCHYFLEGIRLIRSEYLRTNGYFLPPPTTSKACWESYQSLIGKFFVGFDIQTSCGYHPNGFRRAAKISHLRQSLRAKLLNPNCGQLSFTVTSLWRILLLVNCAPKLC